MKTITLQVKSNLLNLVKETPEQRRTRINTNMCVAHVVPDKKNTYKRHLKHRLAEY